MFPSSPSQPPRAAPPAKELPGVAKKPSLPFRGQAPTPLTLRDVATARASTPSQTPTAPTQPKALGAAPGMPQAAPKVASARPVAAPAAPSAPATGPMADDRLQAMKNMQAQAQARPAPSAAAGALDPNRNTLSAGALGVVRAGGMQSTGGPLAAAERAVQQQSETPNMLDASMVRSGTQAAQAYGDSGAPDLAMTRALPPQVNPGDPGTWQDENGMWNYDQKKALSEQNLPYTANELLMGDETQFLMTPEERAAAQAELDKAAMASQWQQANTMAAHGLGGSGVAMTGLGDIAAKRMTAQNELETSDRAQAMAAYMDKLGLVLPATQNAINEADKMKLAEEANMTDKERYEYQKQQDALANKWAALANVMGLTGADQLEAATLAEALKLDPNKPESWGPVLDAWKKKETESGNVEAYNADITPANAPAGWEDSWNDLTAAQQKAVQDAIDLKYDPSTSPLPGNEIQAISGSTWETMTPADKAHAWGLYLKNALTASAW